MHQPVIPSSGMGLMPTRLRINTAGCHGPENGLWFLLYLLYFICRFIYITFFSSLLALLHSQIQCMPHAQACRSLCRQMLEDLPGTDSTAQARKLGQSFMSTGCCVTAHECSSTWIKPAVQMKPRNKDTEVIQHLAQHLGRCAALQRSGCRVVRCYRAKAKQRRRKENKGVRGSRLFALCSLGT